MTPLDSAHMNCNKWGGAFALVMDQLHEFGGKETGLLDSSDSDDSDGGGGGGE